jgi:hypothetical protein
MEDIPRSAMVRRLLKDLREIRQAKARLGLTLINGNNMQVIYEYYMNYRFIN